MEVYSVKDLSFKYPGSDKMALTNISFSVSEGEFLIIAGLSGSGKSTLLRQLKTALTPGGVFEGKVLFYGKSLSQWDAFEQASKIGFVMQSPENQMITDTALHELAIGMENLGVPAAVMKKRIAEISSFLGIEGILRKPFSQLSGGKRQIINLASVLITEPEVIILDEPLSQLDPIGAEEFISLLNKINKEFGTTIIISEHDLEKTISYADRVIVMSDGGIVSHADAQKTTQFLSANKHRLISSLPVSARIGAYICRDKILPMDMAGGRTLLKNHCKKNGITRYISADEKICEKPPYIKLEKVFFSYSKNEKDILNGLDLVAHKGEILSVLGGNGTGKTTLLECIAGVLPAYSGKLMIDGKCIKYGKRTDKRAYLPQDPRSLFVKDTLADDLREFCSHDKYDDEFFEYITLLCGVSELLERNPYDLSGGEQQRAALAKVLLTRPQMLLLDEPVKCLDVSAKKDLGIILRNIADSGVCIIMVTHDMDFAAEYSDRCTLLFDGTASEPHNVRDFFSESTFYTTSARRLSREIIDTCIIDNDIICALSGSDSNYNNTKPDVRLKKFFDESAFQKKDHFKKNERIVFPQTVLFFLFLSFAALSAYLSVSVQTLGFIIAAAFTILFAAFALFFERSKHGKQERIQISKVKRMGKASFVSLLFSALAIPFTIFAGIYYFNDEKYLFISLLIMAEIMIPFFAAFEKHTIKTRELVVISVMCALCVVGRAAFYMFPEFKPVTAIVIISGAALGCQSGFLVGAVGMLASNMIFGQGPWTPWQMTAMGLIGFLSGFVFSGNKTGRSKILFSVIGFVFAVIIYGGIMDPAAIIMSHLEFNPQNVSAYYLSGLPLDLIHGISTAVFLYFLAAPVIKKLERIKKKYGLIGE